MMIQIILICTLLISTFQCSIGEKSKVATTENPGKETIVEKSSPQTQVGESTTVSKWSPSGKYLFIQQNNLSIILNGTDASKLATISDLYYGNDSNRTVVFWSKDESIIYAEGADSKSVRSWKWDTELEYKTINMDRSFTFCNDHKYIYLRKANNLETTIEIKSFPSLNHVASTSIYSQYFDFYCDNTLFYINDFRSLREWDIVNHTVNKIIDFSPYEISSHLTIDEEFKKIYFTSSKKSLFMVTLPENKTTLDFGAEIQGNKVHIDEISFKDFDKRAMSSKKPVLAIWSEENKQVTLYDVSETKFKKIITLDLDLMSFEWSPSGESLLLVAKNKLIIWSLNNHELTEFYLRDHSLVDFNWNPNKEHEELGLVRSLSGTYSLIIQDINTSTQIMELDLGTMSHVFEWSPNGVYFSLSSKNSRKIVKARR